MAISGANLNLFGKMPHMQAIGATKAVGHGRSGGASGGLASKNSNLSQNTVGINESMNGKPMYIAAQAGKPAGKVGHKFHAIG